MALAGVRGVRGPGSWSLDLLLTMACRRTSAMEVQLAPFRELLQEKQEGNVGGEMGMGLELALEEMAMEMATPIGCSSSWGCSSSSSRCCCCVWRISHDK